MRSAGRWLGSCLVALCVAPANAAPVPVWDHSNVSSTNGFNLSGFVAAEDFTLADGATLSGATVWLMDNVQNDNGVLDSFSGALSWGIFENQAGLPGALLATGNAARLQSIDAGVQYSEGDLDIVQVSFELSEPIALGSGTYFLALHENAWGSAHDGSVVWMVTASSTTGAFTQFSSDLVSPGAWFSTAKEDCAVVLYGSLPSWNQTEALGDFGLGISNAVTATQFYFEEPNRFSALDVALLEASASNDGVLGGFSGTLGWAIYTDNAGKPGTILASGSDTAPKLVDTGRQGSATNSDLVRARISFGREIAVDSGTYWLALHEGAWGSAYDGSIIYWASAPAQVGVGTLVDLDPVDPTDWFDEVDSDVAFLLFKPQIYASGFEAGGTCAWSNGASVDCF